MPSRVLVSILFLGAVLVSGCARESRKTWRGQNTFTTDDVGPPASDELIDEAKKTAPLAFQSERQFEMPAYEMPQALRERLAKMPAEPAPEIERGFHVSHHALKVNVRDSTITFTGTLKISGRQDEPFELRCKFEKSSVPWACNMFPTAEKVAKERRLQATVNCLDAYRCNHIGLELFVLIDGKIKTQLFQSEPFRVRRAESGDVEEEPYHPPVLPPRKKAEPIQAPPIKSQEKLTRKKKYTDRLPQEGAHEPDPPVSPPPLQAPSPDAAEAENVTRVPRTPIWPEAQAPDASEPPLSDAELTQLMDDPDAAVEYSAPMPVPPPIKAEHSIPGVEILRPQVAPSVPNQAINYHNDGRLARGKALPMSGDGFKCRMRDDRNWGTDIMIEMLQKAAGSVAQSFPGKSPFVIANISARHGGPMCSAAGNCHASHQTGLDVDIVFPSEKVVGEMWSPCRTQKVSKPGRRSLSTICASSGGSLSRDLDSARFWHFLKTFTCAEPNPVIAVFVDKEIKRHMCQYARQLGEDVSRPESCAFKALQVLKHETGHHDHFHIRLRCPGNRDCRNRTVSLAGTTGC